MDFFRVTLKAAQENYTSTLIEAIDGIKSELDAQNVKRKSMINGSGAPSGVDSKQVRRALRSILTTQDEVWGILRENTRLIEQFGQIAISSASLDQIEINSLPK